MLVSASNIAIVIPARMGSTRFPGKPLTDLVGKPMVVRVAEAAIQADVTDLVLVATPDQEIVEVCARHGLKTVLTSNDHVSGTDRVAEVATKITAEVFINVQGDEPLMDPAAIKACAAPFEDPAVELSSVYTECQPEEYDDPSVVKVVTDAQEFALYFSRYPIPYPRNPRPLAVKKHLGLYGYRNGPLQVFATSEPGRLELAESLEQLRFLERGYKIKMALGPPSGISVDTPEQAEQVRKILTTRG